MATYAAKTASYRRLSLAQVRESLGEPEPQVIRKIAPRLGLTARRFIAHAPFVCLATASSCGADCSPRGDEPGFVRVLDDVTVAVPDRTGNALADSFRNVLVNPAIGMLFLVPGLRETLRVNGTGYVTDDPELLRRFDAGGRPAKLGLVVAIEEVYFHCGKALIRSRLWDPAMQPLADAATFGANVFALQRVETGTVQESSSEFGDNLERSYQAQL